MIQFKKILVITGPQGSGKSRLARAIAKTLANDSTELLIVQGADFNRGLNFTYSSFAKAKVVIAEECSLENIKTVATVSNFPDHLKIIMVTQAPIPKLIRRTNIQIYSMKEKDVNIFNG